jgi:hypothetical protein
MLAMRLGRMSCFGYSRSNSTLQILSASDGLEMIRVNTPMHAALVIYLQLSRYWPDKHSVGYPMGRL